MPLQETIHIDARRRHPIRTENEMMKILLGLALLGLGACKSTADVSASTEPCPADCKMECCMEGTECTAEMKAECQSKCEGDQKTCPVTGKPMN